MKSSILLFLSWLMLLTAMPGEAAAEAEIQKLVDRVVAAVNGDPILHSDIERRVALGMVETVAGESQQELYRRVLDGLIDERVRLHEVGRYGGGRVSVEDVDRQMATIRGRFGDPAVYEDELSRLGLDEAGLRHLVRRQLRVWAHIEERLAPRVFIDLSEVLSYYDTQLRPEMERRGLPLPPIEEVREPIRELLRERRLNLETAAWTEQLRLAADIVSYLERHRGSLPPLVERLASRDGVEEMEKENLP